MIGLLIIGSGFSGLGLAIRLRQQGESDFQIVERGQEVGGTWRDNIYPGCACDVPSHLYSFSFAPNPDWSRSFSPQPEILNYLKDCADRYDVRRFIQFKTTVRGLAWLGDHWLVQTNGGEIKAKAVAMAVGPLSEPAFPPLAGLGNFRGAVFHSAEWDPDFNAQNKKIGVIGNGASAVQFVPVLQQQAQHLVVFQRTAAWVVPRANRVFSGFERGLYRRLPFLRQLQRRSIFWMREALSFAFRHPKIMRILEFFSLRQLARDVKDPALRKKLTPTYTIGCKRILLSDDYWPALAQPNVAVETAAIDHVSASSVTTREGATYELDALIFATGFHVTDSPIYRKVHGEGGRSLSEVWEGSPRAFIGTMAHGFPNLFMLLGPNTGLGHTSVVLMIEAQIDHVLKILKRLESKTSIQPRQDVQDAYNRQLDRDMKTTVWTNGGCASWYLDSTGRNSTLWPKSVVSFRKMIHAQTLEDYQET